jgi:hypothetical protein
MAGEAARGARLYTASGGDGASGREPAVRKRSRARASNRAGGDRGWSTWRTVSAKRRRAGHGVGAGGRPGAAGHQPGNLIVFAPRWNDPVGRLHLGDLIPVEMAGRLDGERYGRIWELDIRSARAPDPRLRRQVHCRRRHVRRSGAPAVVTDVLTLRRRPPPG